MNVINHGAANENQAGAAQPRTHAHPRRVVQDNNAEGKYKERMR